MILGKNTVIRKELFQSIEELTDDQFNTIPSNGGWSPKQIFEHLVTNGDSDCDKYSPRTKKS